MPLWAWIVIVFGVLATLLAIGGYVANRRIMRERERRFLAELERANHALAAAHAADKGWDPARLDAAARREFARVHPGAEIRDVHLVQVDDRPGIEEDRAVFHIVGPDGRHRELGLARRGDDWVADEVPAEA
jgi:hypothetical protein